MLRNKKKQKKSQTSEYSPEIKKITNFMHIYSEKIIQAYWPDQIFTGKRQQDQC